MQRGRKGVSEERAASHRRIGAGCGIGELCQWYSSRWMVLDVPSFGGEAKRHVIDDRDDACALFDAQGRRVMPVA